MLAWLTGRRSGAGGRAVAAIGFVGVVRGTNLDVVLLL